jgi:hypothetical protein
VGVDPATVASVSWQPQGSQQHVHFTPPDQVAGVAPGVAPYKVSVIFTTPGERLTWAFDVTCLPPGGAPAEGVVPVVIFLPVPT